MGPHGLFLSNILNASHGLSWDVTCASPFCLGGKERTLQLFFRARFRGQLQLLQLFQFHSPTPPTSEVFMTWDCQFACGDGLVVGEVHEGHEGLTRCSGERWSGSRAMQWSFDPVFAVQYICQSKETTQAFYHVLSVQVVGSFTDVCSLVPPFCSVQRARSSVTMGTWTRWMAAMRTARPVSPCAVSVLQKSKPFRAGAQLGGPPLSSSRERVLGRSLVAAAHLMAHLALQGHAG